MINSRCTSRPSLSIGLDRSINALDSGWRAGNGAATAGSLRGVELAATVGNVMLGLRMDVFINVKRDGYTDLHRLTLGGFTFQPNMTSNARGRGTEPPFALGTSALELSNSDKSGPGGR